MVRRNGGARAGCCDLGVVRQINSKWTAPVELEREKGIPSWNPVLFHTHDDAWLWPARCGPSPSQRCAWMYSDDDGNILVQGRAVTGRATGATCAKPLVLADGTIVAGSSVEAHETSAAWIERSTDNGKTWAKIGPITITREVDAAETPAPDPPKDAPGWAADKGPRGFGGIIQPSVISLGGKHLRLYARSHTLASKVVVSDSMDNGLDVTPTTIYRCSAE